ncbi:TetR/AcrR family transcriptional regulator [Aquibacillus rhizosphaerae]|uniref:TetR/AcrR family transcriptional regulator n=1 Tax=Aquibacillus rhizosphaerae TaxID=3051431 RepID=A0ABT7L553_9BACI|nr:TetR/AcrR family transcriptional regulator [Aquibacillus sp. LR5S19]MDL4840990.1 TetR/AcrR family transcriptional regulator [Aquibacillus sp. LR5S19]
MTVDRKSLIVDAATRSFSLFGYKATTMDQVAKLANVGKGTIYTFFKNKEELFDEIITSLIKEMRTTAEASMDSSLSLYENVSLVLFKLLEYRKEHQLTIKLFQEEREIGTPAALEFKAKLEATIVHYIKKLIQKAIDNNEIKPCNPEITAFAMLKLYIALIFDWEQTRKPLEKDEISRLFELYFFEGLSR